MFLCIRYRDITLVIGSCVSHRLNLNTNIVENNGVEDVLLSVVNKRSVSIKIYTYWLLTWLYLLVDCVWCVRTVSQLFTSVRVTSCFELV